MKAVIIAAGVSSRLMEITEGLPKTLLPLGTGTILSSILANFSLCNVNQFCIVVGCQSEKILRYLDDNENFGFQITCIENAEWKRGNGISVLAVESEVTNTEFILSMSDHIVSPTAIARVINARSSKNILLVDADAHRCFDIEDATKVWVQKKSILQIGKELPLYNGIDCGIFRLNSRFFDAMREKLKSGRESISAAVEGLIECDDMAAVLMKDDEQWLDIDTPAAYHHATEKFRTIPALSAI